LTISRPHPSQAAVAAARTELTAQEFASLRQILAVHRVIVGSDGVPVVIHVESSSDADWHHVYFALCSLHDGRELPYHLVLTVSSAELERPEVRWVTVQPGTRVYFQIRSEILSHAAISQTIGVASTSNVERGTPIRPGHPKLHLDHRWEFEIEPNTPCSADQRLARLIARLGPSAPAIRSLPPECRRQLSIVFEAWAGNPQFGGLHFDTSVTEFLAATGASLDIDLYGFGPQMPQET
jgi:hypothetical protein